jgi:hypothetical protein
MSAQFNLKAVFSLIDKITAPLKGIDNVLKGTSKAFDAADKAGAGASKSFDTVSRTARNTALSFQFIEKAADKVTPAVTTMSQRISAAQKVLEKYGFTADRMRKQGGRGGLFGMGLGFLGAFGAYELGRDFIHINATQDRFRAALTTTTGSAAGADRAMKWISMFERKAPYDYEQVADTYTQLQSYGLKPEQGALQAVADASGAHGKKLWQGSLAMVDAVNGMYRELKLFGIHAKEDKNQVRLSWVDPKTGQWHAGFAQKGSDAVAALVVKAFESTSAGGMALYARTWDGLMSNLTSAWWRFATMVANSGVWNALKDDLAKLSDWLGNPAHDAILQKWADKIAAGAVKIYFAIRELVTKIDWIKLISDFAELVSGVTALVDKLGGFTNVIEGFIAGWLFFKTLRIGVMLYEVGTAIAEVMAAAEGVVPAVIAAGAAFLGLDVAMGPIGLIILAVAALAAAAFLVVTHWDTVKKWFAGFLDFLTTSPFVPDWIHQLMLGAYQIVTHWNEVVKVFDDVGAAINRMWNSIPKPLRDAISYAASTAAMDTVLPGSSMWMPLHNGPNMKPSQAGPWSSLFNGTGSATTPPGAATGKNHLRADIVVHGPGTVKSVTASDGVETAVHQALNGFQGAH